MLEGGSGGGGVGGGGGGGGGSDGCRGHNHQHLHHHLQHFHPNHSPTSPLPTLHHGPPIPTPSTPTLPPSPLCPPPPHHRPREQQLLTGRLHATGLFCCVFRPVMPGSLYGPYTRSRAVCTFSSMLRIAHCPTTVQLLFTPSPCSPLLLRSYGPRASSCERPSGRTLPKPVFCGSSWSCLLSRRHGPSASSLHRPASLRS